MGICEAAGVWAGHLQGPWKSAGLGRVQSCANDMRSTPTSLCPATLLHTTPWRIITAPTKICMFQSIEGGRGLSLAFKSRSQFLALHLHGRQKHGQPFECHVHASCAFLFALLFELQSQSFTARLASVAQHVGYLPHLVQLFSSLRIRSLLRAYDEQKKQ